MCYQIYNSNFIDKNKMDQGNVNNVYTFLDIAYINN